MSDCSRPTQALSRMESVGFTTGGGGAEAGLDLLALGADAADPHNDWAASRRPLSPRLLLRFKGTILIVFVALAVPVLAHRVIRRAALAAAGGRDERQIIRDIVDDTPVPV